MHDTKMSQAEIDSTVLHEKISHDQFEKSLVVC